MIIADEFKKPFEISKELEVISFKALQGEKWCDQIRKQSQTTVKDNVNNWMFEDSDKSINASKDQFKSFQRAMKVLMVCGQCVGLNPVIGTLENEVSKVRFTWFSLRSFYSITIGIIQLLVTILCLYRLLNNSVNIEGLGFLSFFLTACCTTFLFIRIATKWPYLLYCISNSGLNNYIDPKIIKKCYIATFIMLATASIEHSLSIVSKLSNAAYCAKNETDPYESFIKKSFPWFYDLDVSYNIISGIIIQYINISATINWNYSDMFIVCMSLYLTSVLEQINKNISSAVDKRSLSCSVWSLLRADYTKAARLVRVFDDTFSSVVLLSFASNLFFTCLQLFNVLMNGVKTKEEECFDAQNRLLDGFVQPLYLIYSVVFLFGRFLAVSLVAARVHTAAQAPASLLYNVPACSYNKEVQRFLNQIHSDAVALSGLQFFFITKELVLAVAGTILTYELVLLQFNSEELNKL